MPVRQVSGAFKYVLTSAGAVSGVPIADRAFTLVCVIKSEPVAAPIAVGTVGLLQMPVCMATADPGILLIQSFTDTSEGSVGVDTTWQILATTHDQPNATPRFHRKEVSAGSWTHANGTSTFVSNSHLADAFQFGMLIGGGGTQHLIATAAVFLRSLSDPEIESMISTRSILDRGPAALWDFNQPTVTMPVLDLTRGGANQTSQQSTVVIYGDDPPGWQFGLAEPSPPPIVHGRGAT